VKQLQSNLEIQKQLLAKTLSINALLIQQANQQSLFSQETSQEISIYEPHNHIKEEV
jgi:hypothetical protein